MALAKFSMFRQIHLNEPRREDNQESIESFLILLNTNLFNLLITHRNLKVICPLYELKLEVTNR